MASADSSGGRIFSISCKTKRAPDQPLHFLVKRVLHCISSHGAGSVSTLDEIMSEYEIKVLVVKRPDRRFLTMRYVDPITGESFSRSTKTNKRRDAERTAAKWEKELREATYHKPTNITWEEFRDRYELEKLASLSENTREATSTAFNHVENLIAPHRLNSLTPPLLSKFQSELRRTGIKETSIATHLRHLRAALSWAVSMGMLPKVPEVAMPKRASGRKLMRGRPLSQKEFDTMLAAVLEVRPRDSGIWQRYLNGLWLSGLRLEESLVLSWDASSPSSIDFSGRRPRLRIYAEAEKGHEDRLLPMTPDFAEFLSGTSQAGRTGPAFPILGLATGTPMTPKRISRVISSFGEKANLVVNQTEGKYASAHDLRRSFGTRWASRVKPATLQLLMRHQSIETTMKYYVDQDADEVADELWAQYGTR